MYSPQEIEAFASRFFPGRALLLLPYAYNLTFTGMTAALAATQQLNIAANADFLLLGIRHRANSGALQTINTKTAPFGRVLITDSGTNEQFTAQAVDLENYSTNGVGERRLPYPRIVAGRSSLNITLTMYAPAAETAAIDLLFNGVLIRAFNQ
jgi:hypothetical protein